MYAFHSFLVIMVSLTGRVVFSLCDKDSVHNTKGTDELVSNKGHFLSSMDCEGMWYYMNAYCRVFYYILSNNSILENLAPDTHTSRLVSFNYENIIDVDSHLKWNGYNMAKHSSINCEIYCIASLLHVKSVYIEKHVIHKIFDWNSNISTL